MDIAAHPPARWTAPAEFTILHAEAIRQDLLAQARDAATPFEADLSAVEQFDTAGMQLLCALLATLAREGQQLRLVAPTATVRDVLATYALTARFDTPASGASA